MRIFALSNLGVKKTLTYRLRQRFLDDLSPFLLQAIHCIQIKIQVKVNQKRESVWAKQLFTSVSIALWNNLLMVCCFAGMIEWIYRAYDILPRHILYDSFFYSSLVFFSPALAGSNQFPFFLFLCFLYRNQSAIIVAPIFLLPIHHCCWCQFIF